MILQVRSFHAGFSMLITDVLWVGQKNRTVDATPHLTPSARVPRLVPPGRWAWGLIKERIMLTVYILRLGFCRNPNVVVADFFYDFWVDMNKFEFP